MGTFHAVCVRLLRSQGDALSRVRPGLDASFSVYDTGDAKGVLRKVMQEADGGEMPKAEDVRDVAMAITK